MQFSQVCRQYRILDLKSLVEYCADLDGFEAAGFLSGQSYTFNSGRFLSTLGGALFSLLQRIPVAHFYAYFPDDVLAGIGTDVALLSNKTFFDFLKSEAFVSYVSTNQDAIMHNIYVKDHWSLEVFNDVFSTLFDDREKYIAYIDFLNQKVCKTILTMELHDETILSLYSEIPQLRKGIYTRLNNAGHNIFKSQPGLYPDALAAFKDYMKKVNFVAEKNDETVVENYIGYCLKFFISSAFQTFLANYQTPKSVVFIGENSEYVYANDLIKLNISLPNSTANLAEIFQEVNDLDYAFFARQKLNVAKSMVPYSSIVDFVSDKLLKTEIDELNSIFKSCHATSNAYLQMVPAYRGDIQLTSDGVDQSFRDRIKQGKRILNSVYNALETITPATFEECCKSIIESNSRDISIRKDSNFNIIPTWNANCEGKIFYSDDAYKVISKIIKVLNSLFKLNHELKSYDASLQFLWHSFISNAPDRAIDTFREHTTVASYLSYILSRSKPSADIFADCYGSIDPLYIYITDNTRKEFLKVLSLPRAEQPTFQNISTLSNARVHKSSKPSDVTLVSELYDHFKKIQLNAFEPDLDSCKQTDVIPRELCQLIYRDILAVPYSFRTPDKSDEPADPLSDETLIDYQVLYTFSERKLTQTQYCLQMVKRVIKGLTDDAWECFRSNFSSLCIALLELTPHGELEEPLILGEDIFETLLSINSIPKLSKPDVNTLVDWINIAGDVIAHTDNYFNVPSFIAFVDALTEDNIDSLCVIDSEDLSIVANTFAFRWFYGAFDVLWKYVALAEPYGILNDGVTVLCDPKLITDTAFIEIYLLTDIGGTYTTYMEPFLPHLNIARILPGDTDSCKYVEARALELRKIIMLYKNIWASFFEPLKACCDCIHSCNATVSAFESLELSLRDASIKTDINYHLAYGYDQQYIDITMSQLCGIISWFISQGTIAQTITTLNYLSLNEQQVNSFLLSSIALTDSSYIPRVYKPVDVYYTRQTARLAEAFNLPEYKECLLYNKNTDINIMNDFRDILVKSLIDENGFCYVNTGSYITATDVEDTCHFLSRDGVWVGYIDKLQTLHLMPYAELEKGR